jgi:hypothetical protein
MDQARTAVRTYGRAIGDAFVTEVTLSHGLTYLLGWDAPVGCCTSDRDGHQETSSLAFKRLSRQFEEMSVARQLRNPGAAI